MKIAVCQTKILWEDKAQNLLKAEEMVKRAARNGADIALFPEMSFTGFSMNIRSTAEIDGKTCEEIQKIAARYGIFIGFGWVKLRDGLAENHYTVVNELGEVASDYIKMHSFSFAGEDREFRQGDALGMLDVKGIKAGTFICYDLRFPEVFRALPDDVSMIIVAANWPEARREHWKCLLRARAIENQCCVVGINCVGNQEGRSYLGDSAVISPAGETVLEAPEGEGVFICEINDDAKEYRKSFPAKKDRRPELYRRLAEGV